MSLLRSINTLESPTSTFTTVTLTIPTAPLTTARLDGDSLAIGERPLSPPG